MADADLTAHTQRTQSILKRLIIDNQNMRNTTRYEAVYSAIKNPRDLLDNRIGGVVWSNKPGSVVPLAAPELSPLTMQAIELLNQDGERRSGSTRLGKGLNQDALRYQNADGMVERLTNAGNRRIMRAARDYAQTLLVPLSNYVYRLGVQNDRKVSMVEVQGRFMPAAPQQWLDEDQNISVHTALTPDEAKKHGGTLLNLYQMMAQDPMLAPLFGMQQRHAMMDEIFDAFGVGDSSQFLGRPDDPQLQQQMQVQQQQQMQMAQRQMAIEDTQINLAKSADRRAWQELDMKVTDTMADNLREDEKLEHEKEVDQEELEIERSQQRQVAVG
jgi:hypothetical protein